MRFGNFGIIAYSKDEIYEDSLPDAKEKVAMAIEQDVPDGNHQARNGK